MLTHRHRLPGTTLKNKPNVKKYVTSALKFLDAFLYKKCKGKPLKLPNERRNKMPRLIPVSQRNFVHDPFNFLREEIDRLFDKSSTVLGISPEFDLMENKQGITITAELPGLTQDDIDITLAEGLLTIAGEKKSEVTKDGQTHHIAERKYGSFSRSLKLPFQPEQNEVIASFKDGILTLIIPRPATAQSHIHKIPIRKE